MTTDTTTKAETKRDRVRRLLIHPLEEDGFRKRKAKPDEMHHAFLNRIADNLAYMSDANLRLLQRMLVTKGEGSQKNFWPDYVTIVGWAEEIEPSPLAEDPVILSWFRSKAGPLAMEADCHVETYDFICRKKRPPMARETVYITDTAKARREQHVRWQTLIKERGPKNYREEAYRMQQFAEREANVRALIEGTGT